MRVTSRQYIHPNDDQRVNEFLNAHYQPGNKDGNWLQPIWEYALHHSLFDHASFQRIGIWEAGGEIVALAHYESVLGEAFFQFHPAYHHLREEMLDFAEQNLVGRAEDGRKYLRAYIHDADHEFQDLVRERGYQKDEQSVRPMYRLDIPSLLSETQVPDGFRVSSLAEDCDWAEVNRVLWRGFNHAGEPPSSAADLEERRKMFDTPTARRDLKIMVQALDGHYAAFCGMFFVPVHRYAYVEPVATDPAYRRMGLGRAAVLEGVRRCAALGAETAFVGSSQLFYQSFGFQKAFLSECWLKDMGDVQV